MCALVVYSTESKWNEALRSRIAALPPTALPSPAWYAGMGCDGQEGDESPIRGEGLREEQRVPPLSAGLGCTLQVLL